MNNQAFCQFTKDTKALLRQERNIHRDTNYASSTHRQSMLRKEYDC